MGAVKESLKAQMQRIKDAELEDDGDLDEQNPVIEIMIRADENDHFHYEDVELDDEGNPRDKEMAKMQQKVFDVWKHAH